MVFIMYEDSSVAESVVLLCPGRKIITHTLTDTYTMRLASKKYMLITTVNAGPGKVIMVNIA